MILITGGTGYIGSHTVVELLTAGYDCLIVDNLSNSKLAVLDRIEQITGKRPLFVQADVRDRPALRSVFSSHQISAVIHFAGLKAVGESVAEPLRYYDTNVTGSLVLLDVMAEFGIKRLVFSSSATVYGDPVTVPISEGAALAPASPYGQSKLVVEQILRDYANADPEFSVMSLRYFNPVGAHPTGLIGEDPNGIPNNLFPFVCQTAVGRRDVLNVFGNDYQTIDGTGVRDYIHVSDLALGHIAALNTLYTHNGVTTVNLGTGKGYSVLQVVSAFGLASSVDVKYQITSRRLGDIAACYADVVTAKRILNWSARRDLFEMCADAWRWQKNNPEGYQ